MPESLTKGYYAMRAAIMDEIIESWGEIMPLLERRMMKLFEQTVMQKLSPLQFYALVAIESNQPIGMKELAQELNMSKQQLSKLIQKLIEMKFVNRTHDEQDLRSFNLQITAEGSAFIQEYKEAIGQLLRDKIDVFNDEQLIRFHRALFDLHEVLKNWA